MSLSLNLASFENMVEPGLKDKDINNRMSNKSGNKNCLEDNKGKIVQVEGLDIYVAMGFGLANCILIKGEMIRMSLLIKCTLNPIISKPQNICSESFIYFQEMKDVL